MESSPIRASDKIEQDLRQMIITLELSPGTKVSEADLIDKLGCGRTPLREALQRLAEEYLVVSVPRHGVSIAELSLTDYVQLIEAVSHLEGISAKLATNRISPAEIEEFQELLMKSENALDKDDILSILQLDFEFHESIAKITRNRYLIDLVVRLHRLTSRFIYLAWQNGGSAHYSIKEHKDILQAMVAKDAERAEELTFKHTQSAKERIINAL